MREKIILLQEHFGWLYTKIIENELFLFNLGSFAYFWTGFILFLILTAVKSKQKWLWLIFIILFFDIFKHLTLFYVFDILKPDSIKGQVSGLIVYFSGAAFSYFVLESKWFMPGSVYFERLLALIATLTFSFFWVGFYQYHYNVNLNTQGLNLWAFSLWTIGGMSFFEVSLRLKLKIENAFLLVLSILSIYYFVLFSIEYLAYYIINIRENSLSNGKPLVFGLIHGTLILHIYYVSYPLTIYLFYRLLTVVSTRASLNLNKYQSHSSENITGLRVNT